MSSLSMLLCLWAALPLASKSDATRHQRKIYLALACAPAWLKEIVLPIATANIMAIHAVPNQNYSHGISINLG